jgi:alpha-L-fucosidase
MKSILILLLLVFVSEYDTRSFRHYSPPSSGKYRISPKTGVQIALPTPQQLQWQAQELGVLIHFNLETFHVSELNSLNLPSPSMFDPYLLNTDNWVQTMIDFGAQGAVLVAKHGLGFLMAPTKVTFPLNPSGQIVPYNYTVEYSPLKGIDVLGEFVNSCEKKQIKTGFYYSVVSNSYLHVDNGFVLNTTLQPGQLNVTQATYDSVVLQQVRELWTNYGPLNEIWFDGGYTQSLKDPITALLAEVQPNAVAFNGYGVSKNPIRWIGTEMGVAPDPNWSTGTTNDGGDPDSSVFCPAECDTTLQSKDRWFYTNVTLRPLSEMIDVYHQTVGRNCLLMLDLAPDPTGLIPIEHASRYKELGDFIRSCYGTSVLPSKRLIMDDSNIHIQLFDSSPVTVDRSVIQEDQTNGQVIRAYTVDVQLVNGTNTTQWTTVAQGTSVGNKKIDIWQIGPQLVNAVRLNITKSVDSPVIKAFTVHLCS